MSFNVKKDDPYNGTGFYSAHLELGFIGLDSSEGDIDHLCDISGFFEIDESYTEDC